MTGPTLVDCIVSLHYWLFKAAFHVGDGNDQKVSESIEMMEEYLRVMRELITEKKSRPTSTPFD